MSTFTALYDACVLYPAPVRDLLMHLALVNLFRARWTNEIHDEWIRNVLKNRPDLKPDQLARTRELMNKHEDDCIVSGYEDLIEGLTLPDPHDRHVLAAAIRCGAAVIVTYNIADFPDSLVGKYGIESPSPPTLPDRYRALAYKTLRHGEISIGRFAEYMGISRQEAMKINKQEESEMVDNEEIPIAPV